MTFEPNGDSDLAATTQAAVRAPEVVEWLSPGGRLAELTPGFESRPQQVEMARAVQDALRAGKHLAVEAGTGVGKTFGYLLPAIQYVLEHRRRVVISTHTIALQEQLINKDIPLLRTLFDNAFRAELVKGRSNYLGLRRMRQTVSRQKSLINDAKLLRVLNDIENWSLVTSEGSLSDLPEPPPLEVWEKVRSEHGNCLGRRCPTYDACFYQNARRKMDGADILVVNHALLISDLVLRKDSASVLPDYEVAIIDEGHTIESVAVDHFGLNVTNSQVQYTLSGLFNDRTGRGLLAEIGEEPHRRATVSAAQACTNFFNALAGWQASRGRSNGRLIQTNIVANELSPRLMELVAQLNPLKGELRREEDKYELGAYIDRLEATAVSVDNLLNQALDSHVYWIEQDAARSRRVSLCAAPLDVSVYLRTLLFDRVPSVVMTSATLSTGGEGDFSYLLKRVGEPPARTLRLGSPFDYPTQARIEIEAGLPDPSAYGPFVQASAAAISSYVREYEGRAFVLFTSYQMLSDVAAIVREDLGADGFTILAQGEALPRSKMLERFRETPRAALFGTDSFWQGVDVVGDALSTVIITKLPFAVPDRPTIEARIEQIRRKGGNPFVEFQLPEAILKFRQGFGRLIRSKSDTGRVVVLDRRIVDKPYGKQFLAALPDCPVEVHRRPWGSAE